MARMILAKHAICNTSTFSLYPCVGTAGKAHLVFSSLYPWVRTMDLDHGHRNAQGEGRVHVLDEPFISAGWYASHLYRRQDGPSRLILSLIHI